LAKSGFPDLSSLYRENEDVVWWGITSCTVRLEVLENDAFLGKYGLRTAFCIQCQNGKNISRHSYFGNDEEEVILMPGSRLRVQGKVNMGHGLYVIQMEEIGPQPSGIIKPQLLRLSTYINKNKNYRLKKLRNGTRCDSSPTLWIPRID
jgi:hypothetical protein